MSLAAVNASGRAPPRVTTSVNTVEESGRQRRPDLLGLFRQVGRKEALKQVGKRLRDLDVVPSLAMAILIALQRV
jgi:hypothetical protein